MASSAIPPKPGESYSAAVSNNTRQRRALFCHNVPAITTTPLWRRGTAECSAFFDLSTASISPHVFKSTARQIISPEDSLGMKIHQEGSKVLAEIFFSNEEARTHHCNNGIAVEKSTVFGFPALSSRDPVLRVKLSHLPFLPENHLKEGIFDLLAPYGIVLEGGIFVDHGWFDGTGYAILTIPSDMSVPEITHALPWNDETIVYASWASMPIHCNYCHKPNHISFDCPIKKTIRCWSCLSVGHVRAHCPKRAQKAQESRKSAAPADKSKKSNPAPKSPPKSDSKHKDPPTKRSPPNSDSETEPSSLSRPPPLKQPRPNSMLPMAVDPATSIPPKPQPPPTQCLDRAFKAAGPDKFALALRGKG